MIFSIDKQTINDLDLSDKNRNGKSVFSFFNYTHTNGGKKQLELFFNNPITDISLLEQRIDVLKYFNTFKLGFKPEKVCFDFIEFYYNQQNIPDRFSHLESYLNAIKYVIKPDNEYYMVKRGIKYLVKTLNDIYYAVKNIDTTNSPVFITNCKTKITDKIENTSLNIVLELNDRKKLSPAEFGKLDFIFRKDEISSVKEILEIIYQFDAFNSIVFASEKHGFALPEYTKDSNFYSVEGLFHPFLENSVSNNFQFVNGRNVCFLSGPNMAGKSTFLKSLSISVYLAHIGFPVPAAYLKTSVFNGLLTTINLSDNINKGYSHFYSEVLRVKFVAEQINLAGNIFVVFDEIFRGTNVKDAYEASLAVISSFSK
ncbi:MAG TPA: hypothetical protein VN182_03015, partial [Flavobacterium sp.]|nr:hypothetical protein [Flavobacterium sp.]